MKKICVWMIPIGCEDWCMYEWSLCNMCDMTLSYVWHDAYLCVTWLMHIPRGMKTGVCMHIPVWHVWHDAFLCVTWLIPMCDMTHAYTTRYGDWCMYEYSCVTCVTWRISMCDMTHISHRTYKCSAHRHTTCLSCHTHKRTRRNEYCQSWRHT